MRTPSRRVDGRYPSYAAGEAPDVEQERRSAMRSKLDNQSGLTFATSPMLWTGSRHHC